MGGGGVVCPGQPFHPPLILGLGNTVFICFFGVCNSLFYVNDGGGQQTQGPRRAAKTLATPLDSKLTNVSLDLLGVDVKVDTSVVIRRRVEHELFCG